MGVTRDKKGQHKGPREKEEGENRGKDKIGPESYNACEKTPGETGGKDRRRYSSLSVLFSSVQPPKQGGGQRSDGKLRTAKRREEDQWGRAR